MWHELFDLPAYWSDNVFDIWAAPLRLKQTGCGVFPGLLCQWFGGATRLKGFGNKLIASLASLHYTLGHFFKNHKKMQKALIASLLLWQQANSKCSIIIPTKQNKFF